MTGQIIKRGDRACVIRIRLGRGPTGTRTNLNKTIHSTKKEEEEVPPIIKGLDAIERAQRETISAIEEQTDAILNSESRLLDLPSTFRLPQYTPGFATGRGATMTNVSYGDTRVTIHANAESGADANEIGRDIERRVGELLSN